MGDVVVSDTPLTDALAPLVRKEQLARCLCGSVMPSMEWPGHWNGCGKGGTSGTDRDILVFLDYLRYFERRNGGPLPIEPHTMHTNGWN